MINIEKDKGKIYKSYPKATTFQRGEDEGGSIPPLVVVSRVEFFFSKASHRSLTTAADRSVIRASVSRSANGSLLAIFGSVRGHLVAVALINF